MTTKDYVLIVDTLMDNPALRLSSRCMACHILAHAFAKDNPKFDPNKYHAYVDAKYAMYAKSNER
jgi:hypothetical protein